MTLLNYTCTLIYNQCSQVQQIPAFSLLIRCFANLLIFTHSIIASMSIELGNRFGLICGVYLGTIVPWSFLYLHDFISERWQTVRRTLFNGILHLVVALCPLPYLLFYVYTQAILSEPDYKELFAAVSAAVFSGYHIARTLWGLYHLHRFRVWATETARCFESAGYVTKLTFNVAQEGTARRLWPKRSTKAKQNSTAISSNRSLQTTAADLQSHAKETICSTHDLGVNDEHRKKRDAERECRIRHEVNNMLVNSSVIDNEFINSYSPFRVDRVLLKLRPLHRKGTFVTWAVVYLAQLGRQWLSECVGTNHTDDTWKARRWSLAARVWATAVLRMECECKAASRESDARDIDGNFAQKSFLDPSQWNQITESVEDQLFDKEFALRKIFSLGRRLPYNNPIIDNFQAPLPSHRLYKPLIKETVESLPSRYYDITENITGEHIEWFAVFLWIQRWGGCILDANPSSSSSSESLMSVTSTRRSSLEEATLAPSDTPVRVLQDQLGFSVPATLDRCAFPFLGGSYGRLLWTNRGVLQVSARIDNWIALSIGRQLAFVLSLDRELDPSGEFFKKVHQVPEGDESDSETTKKDLERSDSIAEFHKSLETTRLRNQLANPKPLHQHLEIGLTFMGCVMENTRSGIAEAINKTGQISDWCPLIPNQAISFKASVELCNCLVKTYPGFESISFNSTVQERLLWECQNGVSSSWQEKVLEHDRAGSQAGPSTPETIEAMILCILGFPSIRVVWKNKACQGQVSRNRFLLYKIEPVAGPQSLWIEAVVDWRSSKITVKVCVGDHASAKEMQTPTFRWQDWRDAFEGRLIGKSEWQKDHYMKGLQISRTKASISAGVKPRTIGQDDGDRLIPEFRKYLVWDGWRPFRAGMTMFELKHSSLIIVNYALPVQSNQDSEESEEIAGFERFNSNTSPDAYGRASMSALTDASVHLDSLLTLNKNLVQETDSLTQNLDEDRSEAQLVEFSPVLPAASSSSEGPSFKLLANLDPPLPNKILEKVREQDPIAMHILAGWVLRGTHGFKKDFSRAILFMERALVLGRNVKTARLLVRSLLDKTFAPDSPIDVARALRAVELLWRDMVSRHEVITIRKKQIRRWRGNADTEVERMSKLVKLNLMLIEVQPTSDLMRNLADHLSTWGEPGTDDEETAKRLYESAILADTDSKSMMELGRKHKKRHPRFAAALFKRALRAGQLDAAKHLTDMIQKGGYIEMNAQEITEVYEMASQAGHTAAMRELGLLLLRGESGPKTDILRHKRLANNAAYKLAITDTQTDGPLSFQTGAHEAVNPRQLANGVHRAENRRGAQTDDNTADDAV